jgi:hypothetical protein
MGGKEQRGGKHMERAPVEDKDKRKKNPRERWELQDIRLF